jgi:hypothetical protein
VAAVAAGAPARYARGLAGMVANSGLALEVAATRARHAWAIVTSINLVAKPVNPICIMRRVRAGEPVVLPKGQTVHLLTETRPGHYVFDGPDRSFHEGPHRITAFFDEETIAEQQPVGVSMGGMALFRRDGSLSDGDDS